MLPDSSAEMSVDEDGDDADGCDAAISDWRALGRSLGLPSAREMMEENERYSADRRADMEDIQRRMAEFGAFVERLERKLTHEARLDREYRESVARIENSMRDPRLAPEILQLLQASDDGGDHSDSDGQSPQPWDPGSGCSSAASCCSSCSSDCQVVDGVSSSGEDEPPRLVSPSAIGCDAEIAALLRKLNHDCKEAVQWSAARSDPPPPDDDSDSEGDEEVSTTIVVSLKDTSDEVEEAATGRPVEAAARSLAESGLSLVQFAATATPIAEQVAGAEGADGDEPGPPGWCPLGCPGCLLRSRPLPLRPEDEEFSAQDQSDRLYYYCSLCRCRMGCCLEALHHTLNHSVFVPESQAQRCECGKDNLSTVQLHNHAVTHIMAAAYICSKCRTSSAPGPWAFLEDVRGSPWRCRRCSNGDKGPTSQPLALGMIHVHDLPSRATAPGPAASGGEPMGSGGPLVLQALGLAPGPAVQGEHSYSRHQAAQVATGPAPQLPLQSPPSPELGHPHRHTAPRRRARSRPKLSPAAASTATETSEDPSGAAAAITSAATAAVAVAAVPSTSAGPAAKAKPRSRRRSEEPATAAARKRTSGAGGRKQRAPSAGTVRKAPQKGRGKRSKSEPRLTASAPAPGTAMGALIRIPGAAEVAAAVASVLPEARRSSRARRKPQWEDYDVYEFHTDEEDESSAPEKQKKKRQHKESRVRRREVKRAAAAEEPEPAAGPSREKQGRPIDWHQWEVVFAANMQNGLKLRRKLSSDEEDASD